jgi:hypothetical protein
VVLRWSITREGRRLMGGVSTQLWERCAGAQDHPRACELRGARPRAARSRAPQAERRSSARARFVDELGDDLGDTLFLLYHADGLAGHDGAGLDIAVDHGAAQRAGP